MAERVEGVVGGRTLSFEVGRVAKQAHGAVWVQYGETVVLVAACAAPKASEGLDFFPLTVEYREKAYAAGRIPGSIFKREGRNSETETLCARLIDHQIRPLFAKEFRAETQVIATVLAMDQENPPDILGMTGASSALCLSDIPFAGPIGAVRVGRVNGELILNPTLTQLHESDLDMILSGNRESIISVEGSAKEVDEAAVLAAFELGHQAIVQIIDMQEQLIARCGRPKREVVPQPVDEELKAAVLELAEARVKSANRTPEKEGRSDLLRQIQEEVVAALAGRFPESEGEIAALIDDIVRVDMRSMILDKGLRIDGRGKDELRPITCEVPVLPRVHGSAIFTRGQTQALCVATLGSKSDERMVDDLEGKSFKSFMLDYNFPSYSVGEVRRLGPPSRREIGHGALAEKALSPIIPAEDSFPYTIRVVSEILESNSSSSMATVCAGTLALMDAGVPIKTPIAGAGVGLVKEGDRWMVLTDILGAEDHLGDMDLKVAGSREGITAIQMDIKIKGISFDIMREGLEAARVSRLEILDKMAQALPGPRPELSPFAPRILSIQIPVSKIGLVIGPGGKTIREIEKTGATINVEDDGMITVASVEAEAGEQALAMIRALVEDAEVGKVYEGRVKSIKEFGAFIEILPGKEGLCHISELEHRRVARVEDVLAEGDLTRVKVIGIDDAGKIKLSRKALLEGGPPPGEDGDGDGDGRRRERRERGDRDRDRRPPRRR